MIQDFQVFLNIVGQGLSWFFGLELSDWWAALVQNGTDKFWVAGIVIFLGLILVAASFSGDFASCPTASSPVISA